MHRADESLSSNSLLSSSSLEETTNTNEFSTTSRLFEEEIMLYTRMDDLSCFKYDTLTLDNQKICKLAAVLAVKVNFIFITTNQTIVIIIIINTRISLKSRLCTMSY